MTQSKGFGSDRLRDPKTDSQGVTLVQMNFAELVCLFLCVCGTLGSHSRPHVSCGMKKKTRNVMRSDRLVCPGILMSSFAVKRSFVRLLLSLQSKDFQPLMSAFLAPNETRGRQTARQLFFFEASHQRSISMCISVSRTRIADLCVCVFRS